MNRYILAIITLITITACVSKKKKIVAVDVLLTLPKEIYDQSVQLNQAIVKDNPHNFIFDESHIPHLTLLQCYISEKNLPKVKQKLKELYKSLENDTLWTEKLQYSKEKKESFSSIGIKKSEWLLTLHEITIELLKPYMTVNGSQSAYVQNENGKPIDQFTLEYVPKFVSEHSYENYNPHISLGVAKTALLDSLSRNTFRPLQFQATSISLYQLGDFGTARKLLWKSE